MRTTTTGRRGAAGTGGRFDHGEYGGASGGFKGIGPESRKSAHGRYQSKRNGAQAVSIGTLGARPFGAALRVRWPGPMWRALAGAGETGFPLRGSVTSPGMGISLALSGGRYHIRNLLNGPKAED